MKKSILLCAALAALTACNGNSDNNKSLDYETIDVNFTLKSDLDIPEGTEFGVVALCARDRQQGVDMGEKPVSTYKVSGTASPQRLVALSEEDKIQARESDHGFSFYAVSPYKNNVDVSAMQVSLPAQQNYSEGIIKYLPMLATGLKKIWGQRRLCAMTRHFLMRLTLTMAGWRRFPFRVLRSRSWTAR